MKENELNELLQNINETGYTGNNKNKLSCVIADLRNAMVDAWYNNISRDEIVGYINIAVQFSKRARRRLQETDTDAAFEIGRLSGMSEIMQKIEKRAREEAAIDKAVAEELSRSRDASKQILTSLYDNRFRPEWINQSELSEMCNKSASALSNVMKRLIAAGAVDYQKVGRSIYYHLTPAGTRYYEKNVQRMLKQKDEGTELERKAANEITEIRDLLEDIKRGRPRSVATVSRSSRRPEAINKVNVHPYKFNSNLKSEPKFVKIEVDQGLMGILQNR